MNRSIYRFLSGKHGEKLEIRILMSETAKVFGADAPETAGLSSEELLRKYAIFSSEKAARAIWTGKDQVELRRNLYRMAYRLGSILRVLVRPKDDGECFAVIALLYKNIGISIAEDGSGRIRVDRCCFSDFYTPQICSVISAIDKGIFAGVYHGGELKFRERITEGRDACRARFIKKQSTRKDNDNTKDREG